jgi:hypothetical protein
LKVNTEHRTNYALTRMVGSVKEAEAYGVDVYVAGTDDLIAANTTVTIRQANGIPGWVGMIDVDLTAYADIQLELRQPRATCDCAALFTVSGGLPDRSLISGTRQHLAPLDE